MIEKLFIDTDIILDIVLKREPFFPDSQKVLSLIERNYFSGFTSSMIIANCYIKDFEDGVQYFVALNNNINNFITRNISDYKDLDINVLIPKDFLNLERIKIIIESKS